MKRHTPLVLLAPMAGVTDYAYRRIVRPFGPDGMVTEMVSAKALCMNDRRTREILFTTPEEGPVTAQLFGHDPETVARAAQLIYALGYRSIDLNSGCPTPKIVNNGDGSALMKQPLLLGQIVSAMRRALPYNTKISVKLRLGWDAEHINAVECARIAQDCGATQITVHGRTREMFYSGQADYAEIARVVQAVAVPVIANGDVFDYSDALRILQQTGAAGVMVGRGALGNPWIFSRIRAALHGETVSPHPTLDEKLDMAITHLRYLVELKGEHTGVLEARKHAAWYVKGARGAARMKEKVFGAKTAHEMEEILRSFCVSAEDEGK